MIASIVAAGVILWALSQVVDFVTYLANEGMFWRPVAILTLVGWGAWHVVGRL